MNKLNQCPKCLTMKRFDGDECKRCEEKEIEKQIDNYVLCQKCESDPCRCEKKDLEGLEVIIPDGVYQDCLFYHEVIIGYIEDNYVPKKELKKLVEEMKCELPKDIKTRDFEEAFNHFLIYAGRANYNKALDDVIDVIKKK